MASEVRVDVTLIKQMSDSMFQCTLAPCNSEAILHVPGKIAGVVRRCSSLTLMNPRISCIETRVHVTASIDGEGRVYCHPSACRGPMKCAELFGGIGGWSAAMNLWNSKPAVVVEIDPLTAAICAKNVNAPVVTIEEFLERAIAGTADQTVVVCGDAGDPRLWMGLSLINVAYILASPPCQSWSTAGRCGGLQSIDGSIFSTTLKHAGTCRIHAYMAENVPGLARHSDYNQLVSEAAMHGMRVVIQGIFKCQRVLPVYRDRWLATFIHVSITIDPPLIHRASSLSFICPEFQCPEPGPTLASAHALFEQMPDDHRHVLTPDDDAMNMLSNQKFLPQTWSAVANPSDPKCVLNSRCIAANSKLSGIMARYGNQHKLPQEHLENKGLYTVLFDDHGFVRYFSPWEIIAALGFPQGTALDATIEQAFLQSGNAISVAHAWLQIAKTHILLDALSPFQMEKSFREGVIEMQNQAIKLQGMTPVVVGHFCILVPIDNGPETTHADEPAEKRLKVGDIPPTVPFVVEQTAIGTANLPFDVDFHVDGPNAQSSKHAFTRGGVAFLIHAQKNWMCFVHGDPVSKLGDLIVRALPHARPVHFESFTCNSQEVGWDSMLQCAPPAHVHFQPKNFTVACTFQDKSRVLLKGDVTWTVETALSFLASHIRCNVLSLSLQQGKIFTKACDFLAEYESHEFDVGFKMFMPGYVSFMPPEKDTQIAVEPLPTGFKRFVAAHPQAKVTRTVCIEQDKPIAEVAKLLFPNLTASLAWSLMMNGVILEPSTRASEIHAFTIDWHSYKPLAPTEVEAAQCSAPIDSAAMQVDCTLMPSRWMRSPFSCKPNIVKVRETLSVKQAAASYVAFARTDMTIMCMNGSAILDPNECFRDIPCHAVISFKVAPLKGGGKGADQLKTKIKHVLEQHGVNKDASQTRTDMFLSKADEETLNKVVNTDDITFWKNMKDEANRVHFRLVYRNELQNLKQNERSKPPDRSQKKQAKQPREAFVANPSNIKIDFSHFRCDDEAIEQIDAARFGPDQRGMAVMTCKDANRLSHSYPHAISPEPLAILVVGRNFEATDEVFTLPAYGKDDDPIIIHAALRQFGDQAIEFKPTVPSMQVGSSASTVLEIYIHKNEVGNWRECSVPLHYLGVHVSAVRGSSLLAQWAWKTYSAERQPAAFKEASYWRGFVRVYDEILDSVLTRSGTSGIYMIPKGPDRKHDERFAIITMPDHSLQEVQKKAATSDKSLGIVRVRDQFAIRCRRDNAPCLRALLLPEAAYVASDNFASDEKLWILRNVPTEIGKVGLQQALTQSQWDAHPIRAQGPDRWLVASKVAPPCRHLCINNAFVLVEATKRTHEGPALTMVAKQVKVETVVNTNAMGGVQVATTSRYQEMKAEMSEQFEAKLAEANNRIEQMSNVLHQVQSMHQDAQAEIAQLREEQSFARQKIQEVESSVVQSGQSVIKNMQDMFSQMQQTLESSMKASIESSVKNLTADKTMDFDPEKRARTDSTENKADPFSVRAS
eukprot:Skav202252  [mRNA]  locus=scaffold1417:297672:302195:- [translate_table: standard]